MEYITTKEASLKWGISTTRITILANEGRIDGAQRLGRSWLIPATATKPQDKKPNHTKKEKTEDNEKEGFSFPLYHFRPDWSYIKKDQLTPQQQQLLWAESAVLECRFDEGYKVLEKILNSPDNITTEIGALWNGGICCIALNKTKEYSKIFLRLQMIMNEDIPHRNDLMIILDSLKTYTTTLASAANEYKYGTNVHNQCLPMACLLAGYSQLSKEATNQKHTDISLLELNLRLIENTGAIIVAEFLHLYLFGIYIMQNNIANAEKHAKALVQIAYENKYYFPLVTYYRYFASALAPIIKEYPEEFQKKCDQLIFDYEQNFDAFFSSIEKYNDILKLKDTDYPYIYAIMMNLSNDEMAERFCISTRTVKRRLEAIFKIVNVSNKKELRNYLKSNM